MVSALGNEPPVKGPVAPQPSKIASARGTAVDPVCGMDVDPKTAKHGSEYAGHPYYLCSAGCKAKFETDPAKYLKTRELLFSPIIAATAMGLSSVSVIANAARLKTLKL